MFFFFLDFSFFVRTHLGKKVLISYDENRLKMYIQDIDIFII